jgi:hypothetical protein
MRTRFWKQLAALMAPYWTGTKRWICPALCGCELDITANWNRPAWLEALAPEPTSYQHPIPGTITHVEAAHICHDHRRHQVEAVLFAPYAGSWSAGYILEPYKALLHEAGKRRRYIDTVLSLMPVDDLHHAGVTVGEAIAMYEREYTQLIADAKAAHPAWAASLTSDERLYIHLFRHVGNRATAPCGCVTYLCIDWFDTSKQVALYHPEHTSVCWRHRLAARKAA